MHRFTKALLACVAIAVPTTAVQADGHLGKAVKARKAHMQVIGFNMGNLGAMAKGKAPYDAEKAAMFAGNIKLAAGMRNGTMWPKGSDNAAMPGKTRTLPAAWETWPEIGDKFKEFAAASDALAGTAGNGLDALQAGMKKLGATCGGCHKKFRAKKKK